jgi:hypothetical protein
VPKSRDCPPPPPRPRPGDDWALLLVDAAYTGVVAVALFNCGFFLACSSLKLALQHFGEPAEARITARWTDGGDGRRVEHWVSYEYIVPDPEPGARAYAGAQELMDETYDAVKEGDRLPVRYFAWAPDVSAKPDEQRSDLWFDVALLIFPVALCAWFLARPFSGSRVPGRGMFRRAPRRSTSAPPA